MSSGRLCLISCVLSAVAFIATNAWADNDKDKDKSNWLSAGADLGNSRYQDKEKSISAKTVSRLQLKWSVDTVGDVVAHPAVEGNFLYFPDSAGFLYKVARDTGTVVWQ